MKLRIKNFRSLKDTGNIEIKPITILVGKNSSGKSSFLRTFPMLKQSTEERTKSPILLYGNYIDFGSYRDIKPHFGVENDNKYELGFTFGQELVETFRGRYARPRTFKNVVAEDFQVEYSIKFEESEEELIQISDITCTILNMIIEIKLDHKKQLITSIFINNKNHFKQEENLKFVNTGEFFIDIFTIKDRRNSEYVERDRIKDIISKKIISLLGKYNRTDTSTSTKRKILDGIPLTDNITLLTELKKVTSPSTWHERIQDWTTETEDFQTLRDLIFLFEFFEFYGLAVNQNLTSTFSDIKYIAPLRATAERYYRIQHLAVDEVDPNGKNLPAFLDSLSDTQMSDFKQWTLDNFSFQTIISKIEGHYSIKIVHDKHEINLSDMGFGYSQILPILTQLWYSSSKYGGKSSRRGINLFYNNIKSIRRIIVIEQPELHLHPEFQAKFADAVAKVIGYANKNGVNLNLIIETHSDIIVNRLGDCILDNEVLSSDINIVIFDKDSESEPTTVSIAHYDSDGNLKNWPLGFFLPTIGNNKGW